MYLFLYTCTSIQHTGRYRYHTTVHPVPVPHPEEAIFKRLQTSYALPQTAVDAEREIFLGKKDRPKEEGMQSNNAPANCGGTTLHTCAGDGSKRAAVKGDYTGAGEGSCVHGEIIFAMFHSSNEEYSLWAAGLRSLIESLLPDGVEIMCQDLACKLRPHFEQHHRDLCEKCGVFVTNAFVSSLFIFIF